MIRKISILLFFTSFLTSCVSKKYAYHKRNIEGNKQNYPSSSPYNQLKSGPKNSTLDYINKYKAIAIREMNQYGIPASITLAQGILESGSGNSSLAINANNHFGVKCNSNWTGNTYFKDDDKQNECFRAYNDAEQSFIDHSMFLKKPRYAQLFSLDKADYRGWAYGLKQYGYATNPQYPQLLIGYIEKYNLQDFDNPNTLLKPILNPIEDPNNLEIKPNTPLPILQANQYIVQKGDTLYNLSKRFALSVDELITLNNLPDNAIKQGQILIVKK